MNIEAVDLGLSVNWATCNLNASSPRDSGGSFQWAEIIEGSKGTYYDRMHQEYCYHYFPTYIKDEKTDAATAILGESWRMPTSSEVRELFEKCDIEWLDRHISGPEVWYEAVKFIGPNGNSIVFPICDLWTASGPVASHYPQYDRWNNRLDQDDNAIFYRFYDEFDSWQPCISSKNRSYLSHIRAVKVK